MQENQRGRRRWWRQYWLPFAAVLAAAVLVLGAAVPSYAADAVPPTIKKLDGKGKWVNFYPGYADNGPTQLGRYKQSDVGSKASPGFDPNGAAKAKNGKPLVGRVVVPGKTPVTPPSVVKTYSPALAPGQAGNLARAWGKFLGLASLGMGGRAAPPSNAVELYRAQGVSEGCISNGASCTLDENKKIVNINACTISNTCAAIGATPEPGSDNVPIISLLADVWTFLTGQQSETDFQLTPGAVVDATHCTNMPVVYSYDPANGGTVSMRLNKMQVKAPPAAGGSSRVYYDSECGTQADKVEQSTAYICMDAAGKIGDQMQPYGPKGGWPFDKAGNFVPHQNGYYWQDRLCRAPSELAAIQFLPADPLPGTDWGTYAANMYLSGGGVPFYAPGKDLVPLSEVTTSWSCKDRTGTLYTYTQTAVAADGAPVALCPEGTTLVKAETTHKNKDIAGTRTIGQGDVNQAEMAKYPDCQYESCALDVVIDGEPCTASRAVCAEWQDVRAKTPSRVQCQWGGYVVKLSDCNMLSEGYKSESGVVHDAESGTWTGVDSFGNPLPQSPAPWNPENPAPVTGSRPGTGTGTTPGGSSSTFPTTGSNPDTGGSCISGMWTWNPVDWVMVPVQCALQWAFVPSPTVLQEKSDGIATRIDALGIKPLVDAVGVADDLPGEAGCMGPLVAFEVRDFSKDLYPFQACTEPMSTIATGVKAFFSLGIVWGGGLAAIRAIGAGFGFNFSMKKGGDEE